MTRILVAGDAHENKRFLVSVIRVAAKRDCDAVIQVGDMGVGFGTETADDRFFGALDAELARVSGRKQLYLAFIDGNHDNLPRILRRYPLLELGRWRGFRQVTHRIYYAPRGHTWNWGNRTIMAMGGAVSMDADVRTGGKDWWNTEAISEEDVDDAIRAIKGKNVDVLVCHDAPTNPLLLEQKMRSRLQAQALASYRNRALLLKLIGSTQPSLVIHGHFHHRHSTILTDVCPRPVLVEGLADDWPGDHRSWVIVELELGTFGSLRSETRRWTMQVPPEPVGEHPSM